MKVGVGPPSSVTDEEAEFELALAAEELPKDDPRLLSLLPPMGGATWRSAHLRRRCPYMEVATWPGVRSLWGGASAGEKGGRERVGGAAEGEKRGRTGGRLGADRCRLGCIPHSLPTLVRFPPSSPDWPSQALRVLA